MPDTDRAKFAWRALRKFHNVDLNTTEVCRRRGIPSSQERNVRKQMEQLRCCLVQAKEYFDSFEIASLATKPLQLYYCCMCFALAEILWKGDGNQSLDKLREEHRHHGLLPVFELKLGPLLKDAAYGFRAKPMITERGRRGTFDVWHRFARHGPIIGKRELYLASGGQQTSPQNCFLPRDEEMKKIPNSGVTLLDCFQRIPGMRTHLLDLGTNSLLVRVKVDVKVQQLTSVLSEYTYSLIVQPGDDLSIKQFEDRVLFNANAVSRIDKLEFPSGFSVGWKYKSDEGPIGCNLPEGFSEDTDITHFLDGNDFLNEFGFFYVALYITGMFARYFPDIWMKQIETNTELSIAIENFLGIAQERLPLLTLGELNNAVYLPRASFW